MILYFHSIYSFSRPYASFSRKSPCDKQHHFVLQLLSDQSYFQSYLSCSRNSSTVTRKLISRIESVSMYSYDAVLPPGVCCCITKHDGFFFPCASTSTSSTRHIMPTGIITRRRSSKGISKFMTSNIHVYIFWMYSLNLTCLILLSVNSYSKTLPSNIM